LLTQYQLKFKYKSLQSQTINNNEIQQQNINFSIKNDSSINIQSKDQLGIQNHMFSE